MRMIETHAGDVIDDVAAKAAWLAFKDGGQVGFDFNGVLCVASADTSAADIVAAYYKEMDARAAAYRASPEYAQRQREAEWAEQDRQSKLAKTLATAPDKMTLHSAAAREAWEKTCAANTDGYGAAIVAYAERWARVMEGMILAGAQPGARLVSIEDIAKQVSHIADSEGITGFMYGAAVSILAKTWVHGEALRCWHNLSTQIGDEGERANKGNGVLNTALLSVR